MRPAARVGDWHRCFKQEPAPHIGGMILGPGCTNVVIGGLPAARGSSGAQLTPEMFDVADDKARLIGDNAQYIIRAARAFDVDARTLAAIILRENQDNSAIKEALELPMGFYSEDWGLIGKPSIGLAQIQVATARAIEEQGYIKPTSSDEGGWDLPLIGRVHGTTTMAREKRLEDPAANAMYAAAYMRLFSDRWGSAFPMISQRPDILATLYNLGPQGAPHGDPQPNSFGEDVLRLYPLMASLLGGCGDGDLAACEPALDQLEEGSATVFLGGLPAARLGDRTCHEGEIVTGYPNVLIGD